MDTSTRLDEEGVAATALYLMAEMLNGAAVAAELRKAHDPFRKPSGRPQPSDWRDDALCAQTDPELFFPEHGSYTTTADAKKVCASCNVREQCLQHALAHRETSGIWGGLSPRERTELSRKESSYA